MIDNLERIAYGTIIFLFLLLGFMFWRLFYKSYADDQCLARGYRVAQTTLTGDIYCSIPYTDQEKVEKIND